MLGLLIIGSATRGAPIEHEELPRVREEIQENPVGVLGKSFGDFEVRVAC
jgi:hypothetical protein